MIFDKKIFYFNENKEQLGYVLAHVTDLGAEKQQKLFSVASTQSNLKESHIEVVVDRLLPIRSGFIKMNQKPYTILKVIGTTIYAGEYRGRL